MEQAINQERLISHATAPISLEDTLKKITHRIEQQGDKSYTSVTRQLALLDQLTHFDFGRFLLQNQGINGYWTHYMLTHPWHGRKTGKNDNGHPLTLLEDFILNRAPTMLATQQRFQIFLQENQKQVKNHASLASIPCGMMGELLYLDYQNIHSIQLAGIDYDAQALHQAKNLADQKGTSTFLNLIQADAWNMDIHNTFDLISSNGLNIYEPDDKKVDVLYSNFYQSLNPGGKLVTSFMTPPPTMTDHCEWNMSNINKEDLLLQKIIFFDIIDAKCQCYRSTAQTKKQLETAGFKDIHFIADDANMFPTVVASKNDAIKLTSDPRMS